MLLCARFSMRGQVNGDPKLESFMADFTHKKTPGRLKNNQIYHIRPICADLWLRVSEGPRLQASLAIICVVPRPKYSDQNVPTLKLRIIDTFS